MANDHIEIKNTRGDVIGAGISGTGNIVGKEIHYTVKGNVFNIDNPSNETLLELQKVLGQQNPISIHDDARTENTKTLGQLKALEERMDEILRLVKSTDDKIGTKTNEIQAAEIHISRVDLLVKKAIVLMEQASLYLNVVARGSSTNSHRSKYKEAFYILRQASNLDPYNTEVLLYMAKVESKLMPNNSHAIRKILYRVQNLLQVPKNDTEKLQLGETTFLLAVYSEPISNESLMDARAIFEELGRKDWIRRCDDLMRAYDYNSDDANIWTERGWTLGKLGRYHQALECFDAAIKKKANDVKIWRGKGSVHSRLGQYELAIQCYDKGLELDRNDAGLYMSKGTALYYLEKYGLALDCFEKALEIGQDENTLIGKARILRKLELYQQALEAYEAAAKLNPNNEETYLGIADTLCDLGKNEESIKCYDESIQIDPYNPIAWYGKGEALQKMGSVSDALKCYDKSIEIDPHNALAWYGKGIILQKLGKREEAKKCFDEEKKIKTLTK